MDDEAPLRPVSTLARRFTFDSARHSNHASYSLRQRRRSMMDWCCWFQPHSPTIDDVGDYYRYGLAKKEDGEPQLQEGMIYLGKATEIDLLVDEGASYQDDQWRLYLRDKLLASQESPQPFYTELAKSATFDSALEMLTRTYTEHGCTKMVPRVRMILDTVQPFAAAISAMVQSNPTIACLVWGSVQLTLAVALKFTVLFDGIADMITEITRDLPRFHAYMEILFTPRLHQALREVYDVFVQFNFNVVEFLKTNKCVLIAKMQWSTVDADFNTTKKRLAEARSDFEAEVRLANTQTQRLRHLEVLNKFSTLSTAMSADTVTNVMPSRNPMFEGRINELSTIHSNLEQSFNANREKRSQCSCVVHGVGGMGKTQTALEYVYRYRSCYSYVFWLTAESNTALSASFLAAIRLLPIALDGLNPVKQKEAGLEYLQSTPRPWLIVFDNVENASMISSFWPSGMGGAIIITTQNPDVIFMATSSIHLQPLTPAEGCALIQHFLRRGDSEQEAAEALSQNLGGLPLAITHFAGYVAKSQCTIQQISDAYRDRAKSSHVWTAESVASASTYAHTLATVWDLAWRRLTRDAKTLLEMIAFLDPDGIPEEMFTGADETTGTSEWKHWDTHRFNEAVAVLRERHLVERDLTPTGSSLRTHRALQRAILHRLDGDVERRKFIFGEVTGMLRRALPESSILGYGDNTKDAIYRRYISQLMSIRNAFVHSDPRIEGEVKLLTILRDGAFFLMNDGYKVDGIPLSETGLDLAKSLLESNDSQVFYLFLDFASYLGIFSEWLGIKGRLRAIDLTTDVLKMLHQRFDQIPIEKWTEYEIIRNGTAEHEYGVKIMHFNRVEEASKAIDKALAFYSKVKDQDSIMSWIGNAISFQAFISAARQQAGTAVEQTQRSLDLLSTALGSDNPLVLQAKGGEAMIAFTIGDIERALVLYEDLLKIRLREEGKHGHDTLSCQYNLAVCYQNTGSLEKAESLLREILEYSCINLQWREEDLARVKFRLAVVLRAMNRPGEATDWRTQALTARKAWEKHLPNFDSSKEYTDEDDMQLLDDSVILHHGRTTGIWSDGTHW